MMTMETEAANDLPSGVIIVEVIEGGPAAAAGLQAGDVITGVNGAGLDATLDLAGVIGELEPGVEAILDIRRGGPAGDAEQVVVTLGRRPEDEGRPYLGILYEPLALTAQVEAMPAIPFEAPVVPYGGPPMGWMMPYPYYGYMPSPYAYPLPPCSCDPMYMPHLYGRSYRFIAPPTEEGRQFYYDLYKGMQPESTTPEGGKDRLWFYSMPAAPNGMTPDLFQWYGMPAPGMDGGMFTIPVAPGIGGAWPALPQQTDQLYFYGTPAAPGVELDMLQPHIRIFKALPEDEAEMERFVTPESAPQFEIAPAGGVEL
jgi:hypothetical protein